MPEQDDLKNPTADKPKWTDITVAFFTFGLVIVAVVQGYIFYKQWQEMHSGGTDTHDLALAAKSQADEAKEQVSKMTEALAKTDSLIIQATEQSNATNKMAAASLAANKLTEESVRGKVATYSKLISPIQAGEQMTISVEFKNVGNSAVSIRSKTGNGEWSDLPDGDMPVIVPSKKESEILQPGDNSTIFFSPKILTEQDIYEIDSGQKKPFFFGKSAYDTLGKEHVIEFCFYIMTFKSPRKDFPGSEIDPTHTLRQCDKWHKRDE